MGRHLERRAKQQSKGTHIDACLDTTGSIVGINLVWDAIRLQDEDAGNGKWRSAEIRDKKEREVKYAQGEYQLHHTVEKG